MVRKNAEAVRVIIESRLAFLRNTIPPLIPRQNFKDCTSTIFSGDKSQRNRGERTGKTDTFFLTVTARCFDEGEGGEYTARVERWLFEDRKKLNAETQRTPSGAEKSSEKRAGIKASATIRS